MKNSKFDLEDRLIDFGVHMIKLSESIDKRREASRHLSSQLVRSGTSPGIHYGEAQAAESRKDFIHKMKLILKELRETRGNLKMSAKANLCLNPESTSEGIEECSELIAIFVKSIQTAERNGRKTETEKQNNRSTEKPKK
ncbi:four helix bundle protein [Rhodohalobacter mucosus]|uniref:Four helix bundle protein n=1 Tax=Rhodohalobacter mucosus TaxID=2079485 RepID=A0A316TT55_9BACT|nr:four helix bundle protein [Rhodohalobacter mucosus]PWN05432.1 four helix bundle protein [Rhodohalobacter mucosus]